MNKFSILLMIGLIFLTCVGCDSETSKKDNSSSKETVSSQEENSPSQENVTSQESNSSSQETVSKDSQNKKQQETDPMNLSLGQSYNENGVLITVESVKDSDKVKKVKIKIENKSDEDYEKSICAFIVYNTSGKRIPFSEPLIDIAAKKGETFTGDITIEKDTVSHIIYSNTMNVKNQNAKWIVSTEKETEEEKSAKLREAMTKARESYAQLLPYPATVSFPILFYDVLNVGGGYYETGKLKYKNFLGNEIKSEYRMWYNADGTLTAAELDGRTIK